MRKLLLFTSALLCAASMWAQDPVVEGPWTQIAMKSHSCSNDVWPSIMFANLDNDKWLESTIKFWQDDDGVGYTINGKSTAHQKMAIFSTYKKEVELPSYASVKLTWKYQLRSKSTEHHSATCLYALQGTENDINMLSVDFSNHHDSQTGKEYLLDSYVNREQDGKTKKASEKTKDFVFDNLGGTEQLIKTWYLLLTHVTAAGDNAKDGLHEWGSFKSVSFNTTLTYRTIISFDANGGTGTMDAQTIDGSGKLSPNAFTREGYIFAGWATSADGPVVYPDQAMVTVTESNKGPQTLHAVWTEWGKGKVEGPWTQLERKTNVCPNDQVPTKTFNTMNDQQWSGTITDGVEGYGTGYSYVGASPNTSKMGIFSTYVDSAVVPEYALMTLNWKYRLYSKCTGHHSTVCLYALPGSYNDIKNLEVEFTNQYDGSHAGAAYLLAYHKNEKQDGNVYGSSQKTAVLTFDNRTGSTEQTKKWFMLMTYVMGSAGGKTGLNECGSFKSISIDTTYTYRKIVHFDANDGTGTMADQIIDGSGTLPGNRFTKPGYIFAGWALASDGSVVYTDGAAITASANDKGPVTLYAKWAEGGDWSKPTTEGPWTQLEWKTMTCANSENPSIAFSAMDNTLWGDSSLIKGWSDDDGIGFTVKGKSKQSTKLGIFSTYKNGVEAPSYSYLKMTWRYKLSSKSTKHHSTTCLYGLQGTYNEITSLNVYFFNEVPGDEQQRLAYFNHTNQDGEKRSTDEQTYIIEIDNRNSSIQQAQTWYLLLTHVIAASDAKSGLHEWGAFKSVSTQTEWIYRKIVSLDKNGGSGEMNGPVIDNIGTLPANTFTRTGYAFAGWALAPDGEVVYADGATIKATADDKGPVTLYAVWTPSAYAISYELDGGTATNPDSYAVNTALALTDPTKEDYTFLGWTGSNGNVPQKNVSIIKGMTGDKEYTAHWMSNAVAGTIELINAIGTVEYTDACEQKIDTARLEYDALSEEEQALVTNIGILTAAEDAYQAARENAEGNTTVNFMQGEASIGSQKIDLDYPVAPVIYGYTFLYWKVAGKNLSDGTIRLQAVYQSDDPTDIDETIVNGQSSNRKFIKDGNLYILKDEFIYTINGQKVK